jgi:hypothetical protein
MVAVSLFAPLKLTRPILPGRSNAGGDFGCSLATAPVAGRIRTPLSTEEQRQGSVCFATRYAATCSAPAFA